MSCFVQYNVNLFFLEKAVEESAHNRPRNPLVFHNQFFNGDGSLFLQFFWRDALFVVDWRAELSEGKYFVTESPNKENFLTWVRNLTGNPPKIGLAGILVQLYLK